jgi:hypothetical protein
VQRTTTLAPDELDDWNTRIVAQLAAPRAQRLTIHRDGRAEHLLIDVDAGAWAAVAKEGDAWTVRQGGPVHLWDHVEETVTQWRADGAPGLHHFRVAVTPAGQTVTWSRV